ncbi:MAG: TIGR03088 family PEP-CTERM/XrtA system glycosyltransferase [Casimicrobiaceae bacterium]
MKPPLIAHVVFRFGVGGLENGVVNLVNRLPAERWRHVIISLTDVAPDFADRLEQADVRLVSLGKRPGHLVRDYPRLVRLFRELRPAIVHTRNLASLEAVVPAWVAGVPVRIHGEHGWDMQDPHGIRRRYRVVRRLYRPFVSRYIALSRHLEDYLVDQVGVPQSRVARIANGVDTVRFAPASGARPAIPACPFQDRDLWLVGTVGRLEAVKDPLNLARAFVQALERDPTAGARMRLVIVGDGALRGTVAEFLDRPGVRDKVWLAGERADVPGVLRGLDCFVLPSLAEGISNTILEAMASGLPIVATAVGGNRELIESGLTGTLVPPAHSESLAEGIVGYYRDRAAARRHAKAARSVAVKEFSLDRMMADYAAVYEQALAAAGTPIAPGPTGTRPTGPGAQRAATN